METEQTEGGQVGLRNGLRPTEALAFWKDIALVAIAGLVIRLVFLAFSGPHLMGSGLAYAQAGSDLVNGSSSHLWLGSFGFWQGIVQWLTQNTLWGGVIASLIPGVLLIPLAHVLALSLAGRAVGYFSGLFCAIHPLLVSYSCNGFGETFCCFWLIFGLIILSHLMMGGRSLRNALISGLCFGLAAATRNEILPLALLAGLMVCLAVRAPISRRILLGLTLALTSIGVFLIFLATPPRQVTDTSSPAVESPHQYPVESGLLPHPLVPHLTAPNQLLAPQSTNQASLREKISIYLHSLRQNLTSGLPRSTIRLCASPLPILTAIVIVSWILGRGWRREFLPICLVTFSLPIMLLAFPLEPRNLMPILIPVHLIAAIGIVRTIYSPTMTIRLRWAALALVPLTLAILLMGTLWKGVGVQQQRDLHQLVSSTLSEIIPQGEIITGCGDGNIEASTFLSGHRSQERIRTEDPLALAGFMESANSRWLVLYEEYITQYDPPFRPYLNQPLRGFEKIEELLSPRGGRIQILRKISPEDTGEKISGI